jgi:preprotein translocase subunit SecG
MDSGTLIVAVIMLALIIVPVVLISRAGKKKQE